MTEKRCITNNSEILFIYDAKNSNPNGDMDDENKPRMDKATNTNLVSDVRLKRYIRDYLKDFKGMEIFVEQTEKSKDAKSKAKELGSFEKIKKLIDVKFFGAISTEEKKANNITGPIQLNWGYSLNPVELLKSKTITSHFKTSGSSEKEGGAGIGKDFRVKYSLIAFNGSINYKNAEKTNLTEEDLQLFDESIIKSIPLARTRSKIGQFPRLYLRVILKEGEPYSLKDLREYIKIKSKFLDAEESEKISSINDIKLEVSRLLKYLENNKNKISGFILWVDDNIKIIKGGEEIDFESELKNINDSVHKIS